MVDGFRIQNRKTTMMMFSSALFYYLLVTTEAFLYPSGISSSSSTSNKLLKHQTRIGKSNLFANQKRERFDFDGFSDRLRSAYDEWCHTYNERIDDSRMEVFSYHFMVAENYFRRTGVRVKLNEYAGLTDSELPQTVRESSADNPLGAEFLDLMEEDTSSGSAQAVLDSGDDSMGNHNSFSMPFYGSSGRGRSDPISNSTNAYLESASKDSIVPPFITKFIESDEDRIEEATVRWDNKDDDKIIVELEDASDGSISPHNFDEETYQFLSSLDLLSKDHDQSSVAPVTKESTWSEEGASAPQQMNSAAVNSASIEVPPTQDLEGSPVADITEVGESSLFSNDGFDPVEAYYIAPQEDLLPKAGDQTEVTMSEFAKVSEPQDVLATPMAIKAAEKAQIDLSSIHGTGKMGRITLGDVEAAIKPAEPQVVDPVMPTAEELASDSPETSATLNDPSSGAISTNVDNVIELSETTAHSTESPLEEDEIPALFDSSIAMEAAQKANLDVSTIQGTGQHGRKTLEDVDAAIKREKEERKVGQVDPAAATSWTKQLPRQDLPDWVVGNAPSLAPSSIASKIPIVSDFGIDDIGRTGNLLDDSEAESLGSNGAVDGDGARDISPDNALVTNELPLVEKIGIVSEAPTQIESVETSWYDPDAVSKGYVDGFQVLLPELSFWMREAKVLEWQKRLGDPVRAGETLLVVECDTKISKETQEYAATHVVRAAEDGYLVAKHFNKGEMISVGWTVAVIGPAFDSVSTGDNVGKGPAFANVPSNSASSVETAGSQGPVKPSSPSPKSSTKPKEKTSQKSTPMVQWESKVVKGDGLNHVMIPFLQKKLAAIEESSRFRLPAGTSSSKHAESSIRDSKSGLVVRWEGRKEKPVPAKPVQKMPSFKVLPSVSWQYKRSEVPSPTSSTQRQGDAVFYLAPSTSRKRRLGKTHWGSFTSSIIWECDDRRRHPSAVDSKELVLSTVNATNQSHGSKLDEKPVYATPMARVTAQKAQIDLSGIQGSGDHGRVTLDDVKDILYPLLLEKTTRRQFVLPPAATTTASTLERRVPFATPMARKIARDANIELSTIRGTGDSGRITLDDVNLAVTTNIGARRELSVYPHG